MVLEIQTCSPVMIDPINRALSNLSQRPLLTKGLLKYLREQPVLCPVCGRKRLDQVLSVFGRGGRFDCEECARAGEKLEKLAPPAADPWERKVQAGFIGGLGLFGLNHHFVPAAPILVTWEITARCNMGGCKHCHIDAGRASGPGRELTTAEAEAVTDQLAEWGVSGIAFTGGESLLRSDFIDLVRYATDRGLACYMATNGLLLTPENIKALKQAGLCMVHISLDGGSAETHDRFRGYPGAFDQVIAAVKNCHEEALQVALAATPTRLNDGEMPEMLGLADRLEVDWFITYNYVPAGRGGIDLDLEVEEKDRLWSELGEAAGRCRKTRWLSFAPQMSVYGQATGRSSQLGPTHYYEPLWAAQGQRMLRSSPACMAGRYYLAIKADGRVTPCIFLPEEVGNVRRQKLAELWSESPVLAALRDLDRIEGDCGQCAYRTDCGGCRARARAYTGHYLGSDHDCPVSRRLVLGARAVREESVGVRFTK